jgi:hypothetical protein
MLFAIHYLTEPTAMNVDQSTKTTLFGCLLNHEDLFLVIQLA